MNSTIGISPLINRGTGTFSLFSYLSSTLNNMNELPEQLRIYLYRKVASSPAMPRFLLHIKHHWETKTFIFLLISSLAISPWRKCVCVLTIDFNWCSPVEDLQNVTYALFLKRPSVNCPEKLLKLADNNKNSIWTSCFGAATINDVVRNLLIFLNCPVLN